MIKKAFSRLVICLKYILRLMFSDWGKKNAEVKFFNNKSMQLTIASHKK